MMRAKHLLLFPAIALFLTGQAAALEQRQDTSYLRGPYNGAFFHRENQTFRVGAAIHFAHAIQHDTLQLEPL